VQGCGDERAGRPGVGQGAQVGEVAHAAAGQQLELGKAGAEIAHQGDVGTGPGSDTCEVEHDHLPHARASQPCQRLGRSEPGELGIGREDATLPKVEAEHERGVGKLRPQLLQRRLVRKRFSADQDARSPELEEQPDRGDLGDAGIDHHPRLVRQCRDDLAIPGTASDRVEIGDVELAESERFANGARDLDGIGARDDPAAQRAVAFALPAHGVHGGSALEIDDRDHSY
jgi:hypothetical protein